jgi:pyruvate ferredoxin oxidoreductase gamma subunit
MLQIRIHGRGGQGVVTAAELLSIAAFEQGRHAQAFPSFGSERTGAPVVAFCRIDDHEIRLREPVLNPDVLIVQDPTLLHQVDVFQGLPGNGYVLTDRATWLSFKNRGDLAVLVEGDKRLFNQYGVMAVSQAKHPHVKAKEAQQFVDWIVSPAGQAAVAAYKIGGEQLFFPNATK